MSKITITNFVAPKEDGNMSAEIRWDPNVPGMGSTNASLNYKNGVRISIGISEKFVSSVHFFQLNIITDDVQYSDVFTLPLKFNYERPDGLLTAKVPSIGPGLFFYKIKALAGTKFGFKLVRAI